jgi:hypothetical protein
MPSEENEDGFCIYPSDIKGGEECWGCGMTPGITSNATPIKSIMLSATHEKYEYIDLCEDCCAVVAKFFVMNHLAFLKDREKNKDWIFAGTPSFPQDSFIQLPASTEKPSEGV